jgi:hypothetical protein
MESYICMHGRKLALRVEYGIADTPENFWEIILIHGTTLVEMKVFKMVEIVEVWYNNNH